MDSFTEVLPDQPVPPVPDVLPGSAYPQSASLLLQQYVDTAPANAGPRQTSTALLEVAPNGTKLDLQAVGRPGEPTDSAKLRIAGILRPDAGHPEIVSVYEGWRTIIKRGAIAAGVGLVGTAAYVAINLLPNSVPSTPDVGDDRESSATASPSTEPQATTSVIVPITGSHGNQAPITKANKAVDKVPTTTVAPLPPPVVTTTKAPATSIETATDTQDPPKSIPTEVVNNDDPVVKESKAGDSNESKVTTSSGTGGGFTDNTGDTATDTNNGGDDADDGQVVQDQNQQNTGN